MKIKRAELLKRGWSDKEINDASRIIERAENQKHVGIKFLDKSVYWALLFLLIVVNALCSVFLIPFLFAFQNIFSLLIMIIVAFVFGVLFAVLVADIDKNRARHHPYFLLTLVISGVINVGLILYFSRLLTDRGLQLLFDLNSLGAIYLLAFVIPYVFSLVWQQYHKV